jgi:hypothetical protein
MYSYLVLLFCLTTTILSYNTQDYFDPKEKPNGESPDGGMYLASFNFSCDPWKNFTYINDAYYDSYPDFDGDYCPEELRSPSGCGDFKGDTRGVNCTAPWKLKYCSMKIILDAPQPVWKQVHVCAMEQMPEYQSLRPTLTPFGDLRYPPFGLNRHRDYWAKLGEYEYLPPERWLHNTEHGAVAFLYQPCIDPEELCKIKQFILSRPYDNTGSTKDPSNTGPFRWVLTPYKNLITKFAVVTFYQTLYTDCFDWNDWNEFIDENYREGFEDLSLPGRYDYLWIGNSTCPGYDPIPISSSEPSVVRSPELIGVIVVGVVIAVLLIIIIIILVKPKAGGETNYTNF